MKNIFSFSLLLASILIFSLANAQDKNPVKISFSSERVNDSLVYLKAIAHLEKGTGIFTTLKESDDAVFISSFEFDSTASKFVRSSDKIEETGSVQTDAEGGKLYFDSVIFKVPLHILASDSALVKGTFAYLTKSGDEYPSGGEKFSVKVASTSKTGSDGNVVSDMQNRSLWSVFWLCLFTGLLAVFTPCVFPLMPVTVSFFLKKSKTRAEGIRSALIYSLSIILIFTVPTIILTRIFGDKVLYTISTHPISNLAFFAIFVVFAISFFGAFELTLPSSWSTKADQKAGKGGLMGIFFMALTLVIVSFSCTGPIVGALLGQTSGQGVSIAPVIGILAFSIGLAFPFTLFALFPSALQSLPKSGGWLNSVKVTFGFVELALGMKFLSNADLIYGWHLLDREIFLVIWIVLAILLGMYLLGKLKFSHDSDLPYISVPRLFLAIGSFCFGLYLIPGLWGAPLKAMSGLLPPTPTQDFNLDDLQYKIGAMSGSGSNVAHYSDGGHVPPPKKYIDKLHVPYGLQAYYDLEEGMAAAKILKKPVMLDFTGFSCANCRKMENAVWKDPEVLRRMKNDFVLVSLYVDATKIDLPENEQYTNARGEKITTLGAKNLDYQVTKFSMNAQPLYMFLDLEGTPLSEVRYGYDPDIQKFINHLETVKQEFEKRQSK